MSLESFDKFCEKMIMGEPGSEKEIYDERQNQIRTKLTVEALWVYVCLSGIFAVTCNEIMWCESVFSLMAFSASVSYLWWVIRNVVKSSLFGVKGNTTLSTAVLLIFEGFIYILQTIDDTDEGENLIINEGIITDNFVILVALVLMIITGIIIFVANHQRNKLSDKDR